STAASERDGGQRHLFAVAPPAVAGSREEAGDGPHGRVGPVFVPSLPRDLVDPEQTFVVRAGLDRAPGDGLVSEGPDQSGGLVGARVAAIGLIPEAEHSLLPGDHPERLAGRQLVALALADVTRPAVPEHDLEVVTGRLVGGHDPEHPAQIAPD